MLVGFLVYLGFSALGGQFGIESRNEIQSEIELLSAESATLQVKIESLKHRISLFEPTRIDPDILTERARAMLSMATKDDIFISIR